MEEILASIRRIIEDSDPGQPQAPSTQAVANDDGARAGLADRAPLRSPAMPERNAAPREERVAPAPARAPEPAVAPAMRMAESLAPAQIQQRQAEGRVHHAAADSSRPAMTSGKSAPVMPDRTPPESARTEAPASPAPRAPAIAPSAPLVSKDTGRHVSAAFDELAAAVEDTRRRSFDRMAQEMMRPMLQEWLDQNLPSLVERLVREEIGRITGSKADIAGKP